MNEATINFQQNSEVSYNNRTNVTISTKPSTDTIWKEVVIVVLGPFAPTVNNNSWIALMLDPISYWIDSAPLQSCSAISLANFVFNSFTNFGFCQCFFIGLDNCTVNEIDSELQRRAVAVELKLKNAVQNGDIEENKLNFRLSPSTFVKGIISTSVQSEYIVQISEILGEKFGKSLQATIATLEEFQHSEMWDSNLSSVLYQLRITKNDFGNSPFYSMFQRCPYGDWFSSVNNLNETMEHTNEAQIVTKEEPIVCLNPSQLNELHVTILADYPEKEITEKKEDVSETFNSSDTIIAVEENDGKKCLKKQRFRKLEKELPYKCPKCSATYLATENELQFHLECHVSGQKLLQCPKCPKTVKNWSHLQRHLLSHDEVVPLIRLIPEEKRKCNICGKVFQTRERMLRHEQTLHASEGKYECQFCGRKYKERITFARHIDLHANNLYSCDHCNYKTKIRKNFLQHSRIHEGRGFQCHVCSKIFSKAAILTVHLDTHNSNRTQYQCNQCGVKLSTPSSLRQHLLNIHQKTGTHSCDQCNYIGKSKANLLSHYYRMHNKPVKCDKCSYSCNSESALKRHDNIIHNETERQFACAACPYRARDSRQLKEHIRFRHNPNSLRFLCHFCNSKFKTMTMLRHHLPVHTGQHLYNCQLCGYSAKFRQTLHHHVKARHPEHRPSDIIRGTPSSSISCSAIDDPISNSIGGIDVQEECSEYIEEVIITDEHNSALIVTNISCETGNGEDGMVVECDDLLIESQGEEDKVPQQTDKAIELLLLAMDPNDGINQVASEEMVQTSCG